MNTTTEQLSLVRPDASQELTPMGMLQIAVAQGADIDKLSKLMDLQERWEANQARKEFVAAMAAFKRHAIVIVKDKENTQYKTSNGKASKYSSLGNLVSTVTPFLSEHALSIRWDIDQASGVKVTCIVTHAAGHSESVSMVCPPDKSGAKNPIQEIKSAITYAKACTFESICGLASTDANLDDDGNGSSSNALPEAVVIEHVEYMKAARTTSELQTYFARAYKLAEDAKDKKAMQEFIGIKDARKKALNAK